VDVSSPNCTSSSWCSKMSPSVTVAWASSPPSLSTLSLLPSCPSLLTLLSTLITVNPTSFSSFSFFLLTLTLNVWSDSDFDLSFESSPRPHSLSPRYFVFCVFSLLISDNSFPNSFPILYVTVGFPFDPPNDLGCSDNPKSGNSTVIILGSVVSCISLL